MFFVNPVLDGNLILISSNENPGYITIMSQVSAKLSPRCRYATRAMIEMAKQYGEGPVSLKTIEENQNISRKYLQQLMPPLKRDGLVRVVKGKGGGFLLARPPSEIKILEIIHAEEGKLVVVECVEHEDLCDFSDQCPSREIWLNASKVLEEYFASMTLEEVVKRWDRKVNRKVKRKK